MGTEPGIGVPDSATVAQALGALKREGSNILLVGDADSASHESACKRLLGDSNRDSRYRLFVVTGRPDCAVASTDHESAADDDGGSRTRFLLETPADEPVSDVDFSTTSGTETTLLGVLGSDIVETIDDVEYAAGGLDPSELRVCVDSIGELLENHESENVFRLLHVLTTRVRQADGMGHYHLPVQRDHEAVRLLEPLFDAVVEIRSSAEGPEHRWHLRDKQTTSDWVEL